MQEKLKEQYSKYGNFFFVRKINPELYDQAYKAERYAKSNLDISAKAVRSVYEKTLALLIDTNSLQDQVIYKQGIMRDIGLAAIQELVLLDNRKLPSYSQMYEAINRRKMTNPAASFIRRLGNTASHDVVRESNPKITYSNVLSALNILQDILGGFYNTQIPEAFYKEFFLHYGKNIDTKVLFQEDFMPIYDFRILDALTPRDKARSHCSKEYIAYTLGNEEEKQTDELQNKLKAYYLVRQYPVGKIDYNFIMRNHHVQEIAAKHIKWLSVPLGMTEMEVLKQENESDPYIHVAYKFKDQMKMLDEITVKAMGKRAKVELLLRLAQSLEQLHTLKFPIYHRNLSNECIYVVEYEGEVAPYIVKFDFAKIDMGEGNFYTVQEQASIARDKIKHKELEKYVAPEWNKSLSTQGGLKLNWGKLDVYSFGVLIMDILTEDFKKEKVRDEHYEWLESQGYSDDLILLVEECLQEQVKERPDMEKVFAVLKKEEKRWS